jgi:hypothetical protein
MKIRKYFAFVLYKRVEHVVDLLALALSEGGSLQPNGVELRFDDFLATTLPGRFKQVEKLFGAAYFCTREFLKLLRKTY